MKTILLLFTLLFGALSYSQTEMGYQYLNEVDFNHVQGFLSESLAMSLEDDTASSSGNLKTFTYNYVDKVAINQEPARLKVAYTVFQFDGDFVVKDVTVTGDFYRVLDFYVTFWNTTLKFEEAKAGEVVVNHYGNDRIAFISEAGNKARIEVKSDKFKTPEEYLSYWR